MIRPPAALAVLGGGQLGRFFVEAAARLGYRTWVLDPDPLAPAGAIADRHLVAPYDDEAALQIIASECDAATVEFENVPAAALAYLAERIAVHPSPEAVAVAQDRRSEKALLREAGLEPAPYRVLNHAGDLSRVQSELVFPVILKTARLGYDGKGQVRVLCPSELERAWDALGRVPAVAESEVALAAECSVVLARNAAGQVCTYPVARNTHRRGILATSLAPSGLAEKLLAAAREQACRVAEALQYVGVLAVEFFITQSGELLANEIAPRPHNSGHYTLDACYASQFEQQVRALCGLPLASTALHSAALMVNLLGDLWFDEAGNERQPAWEQILALPQAVLRLYGKRFPRPGRKMGHLTLLGAEPQQLIARFAALNAALLRWDISPGGEVR